MLISINFFAELKSAWKNLDPNTEGQNVAFWAKNWKDKLSLIFVPYYKLNYFKDSVLLASYNTCGKKLNI